MQTRRPLLTLIALCAITARGDDLKRRAEIGAEFQNAAAGIRVREIKADSLAAKLGIAADDHVIAINGRNVASVAEAQRLLRQLHVGDKIALDLERAQRGAFKVEGVLPEAPREKYDGADVIYDPVRDQRGERLRTIVTKPDNARERLPVIFIAGWLSDDSIEAPDDTRDSACLVFRGLAALPNFATMRMDKPGVGDSEGDCAEADFDTELSGYRAAFESLSHYDFIDPTRVFVFGISNGGGFAPLVAKDPKDVRGYIVVGGWVKTWFEHMMEIERRRLALSGKSPGDVNSAMKHVAQLYERYLVEGETPEQVLRATPELKDIWSGDGLHQYGRPVAFYQQLQRLNLDQAWSKVSVPTLVLHGQFDWIMSRDDHERIATLVNANTPGAARFEEVPNMGHTFQHFDSIEGAFQGRELPFDPAVLRILTGWLAQQTTQSL